jgi:type IV secretion system coupling TraD/TrwB family protein
MSSRLQWRQVHWPRPLDPTGPGATIQAWAADQRSPLIVLEARASAGMVEYLLGSPAAAQSAIGHQLTTAVPEARLTDLENQRQPVRMAGRLHLTSRHRPLRTDAPEATIRQLLGALARAGDGELLVLQLLLGPRRVPLAVPNQSPSSIIRPWYQVAWEGKGGLVDGEKRAALRTKVAQHGFAVTIRLGATAPDVARQRALIHGLYSALRVSEAPGVRFELVPGSAAHLNAAHAPWRWRLRLNAAEALACTAWPIGEDDLPGHVPLHPRRIAPTTLAQPADRLVGRALAPGVDGQLGYAVRDALRHTWVLGPNGTGKSTLLLNLIDQDLRAGRPVVVIEPKDLISDLLERIPPERQDDIVLLDCLDDAPVGINPLQRHGRRPDVVADGLFSLLTNLYGDSIGPRSSDILLNCLNVLAERDDSSLVMVPLLLTNTGFRRSLTKAAIARDPFGARPFWTWFENLRDDARAEVVGPLQNKLRPLIRPALRGVLGQRRPRFNIRQVLTESKVLLVPLQKGVIGPDTAELLGAIVVNELWLAIRERAGTPAEDRTPVMLILDELQEFCRLSVDFSDALATSRSLGAAWHAAHQYREQLSPALRKALQANARSRICFQLSADDARAMAAGQSVLSPEDFSQLPAFHIYASLLQGNTVQPWASGVTFAPPAPCSDPAVIRRLSRERYGQPLDVVEAEFAALLTEEREDDGPVGRRRRGAAS